MDSHPPGEPIRSVTDQATPAREAQVHDAILIAQHEIVI